MSDVAEDVAESGDVVILVNDFSIEEVFVDTYYIADQGGAHECLVDELVFAVVLVETTKNEFGDIDAVVMDRCEERLLPGERV